MGYMMGALIMTHSDDNGLVLPPALAPIQVVIVPIYKGEEQLKAISDKLQPVINELEELGVSVKYDNSDNKRPGFKFADYLFVLLWVVATSKTTLSRLCVVTPWRRKV